MDEALVIEKADAGFRKFGSMLMIANPDINKRYETVRKQVTPDFASGWVRGIVACFVDFVLVYIMRQKIPIMKTRRFLESAR